MSTFILPMGDYRPLNHNRAASASPPARTGSGDSRRATVRSVWWRSPLIGVILGGMLMGLTPEPVNAWPLAWVALVPLWRVVVNPTVARTALELFGYGSVWSGIYHGIVLSWITHLHPLTWMGVPWLASLGIALFAWAFITGLGSVTFGLWAVLFRTISDRARLNLAGRLLLGTALWCLLETALSWGPLYWPALSFTQSPHNLWILHIGRWGGPMAVTAAIVAVNGCWAEMTLLRSRDPGSLFQRWRPALIGAALLVGLHGLGGALYSRPLSDLPAAELTIGLIQGNIPTRIKLTPAGTRRAIAAYADGYRTLVDQGVDAVLTPEGAVPEVWTQAYQSRSPLLQAVMDEGVVLWLGTFRPIDLDATPAIRQSLVTLEASGQVTSQYDKVKLVPLGEYIPFESTLGRLVSRLSPVSSSLVPGSVNQVFETPFGRAIIGICYESPYSELFRRQAANGGEWIMTASNNDPYPPTMMRQHHAQDVMRAIETDRWAVRVTNTGISGVVTPHGRTQWLSEPNQYVIHVADIYRRQTRTPYVQGGNALTYFLVAVAVIICGFSRRRHA